MSFPVLYHLTAPRNAAWHPRLYKQELLTQIYLLKIHPQYI